jgi:hypothetical protein
MLWRALRPHQNNSLGLVRHGVDTQPSPMTSDANFKWPALGKFEFSVIDATSHQAALRHVAEAAPASTKGKVCVATLLMGGSRPHVYKPVEVCVGGQRVAFLSSGDASRFQRRLAYEGRAGQTTSCDALLVESHAGGRTSYDIRLDLKAFRH